MIRRRYLTCRPACLAGITFLALVAAGSRASPDGAEWATLGTEIGCRSCHLSNTPPIESSALTIEGLPREPAAGQSYLLTIRLEDPELRNAGFLLGVSRDGADAGQFAAKDKRVETEGARARSNWDGSFVDEPGSVRWQLVWIAPSKLDGTLRFELWGNAGNFDASPLEDHIYKRVWQIPPPP